MARILYLIPGVGMSNEEKKRREKLANSFLTQKGNKIIVEEVNEGPIFIESSVEEYMSVGGTLKKLIEVQSEYDAAIIGCAGDPGLAPARELIDIPIIGPAESSIYIASMLGEKFSIITILDSVVSATWRMLRDYGMDHKCASIRVINFPVLEMNQNRKKVAEVFLKEAKIAMEKDRASSIVMGCMTQAFLLLDEMVKDKIDIPVINPAKISVKIAEMLASLKLKQSRVSFPKPNYEKLKKSIFPEINIIKGRRLQ